MMAKNEERRSKKNLDDTTRLCDICNICALWFILYELDIICSSFR